MILLACLLVCRIVPTDGFLSVPPLDLEVVEHALAYRFRMVLPLFHPVATGSS